MNDVIDPDAPAPFEIVDPKDRPVAGMLLHCGAELVDRPTLNAVPTPCGTTTAIQQRLGVTTEK